MFCVPYLYHAMCRCGWWDLWDRGGEVWSTNVDHGFLRRQSLILLMLIPTPKPKPLFKWWNSYYDLRVVFIHLKLKPSAQWNKIATKPNPKIKWQHCEPKNSYPKFQTQIQQKLEYYKSIHFIIPISKLILPSTSASTSSKLTEPPNTSNIKCNNITNVCQSNI